MLVQSFKKIRLIKEFTVYKKLQPATRLIFSSDPRNRCVGFAVFAQSFKLLIREYETE